MAQFKLKIVTPDKIFFDEDVNMLVATGTEGEFAILANHTPFVTLLKIGKIKIKENDTMKVAAIAGGYIVVKNNVAQVVSEACEWVEEIDLERAEHAKEKAEEMLRNASNEKEEKEAKEALKRTINRIDMKIKNN